MTYKNLHIVILFFIQLVANKIVAQYPQHFTYDDENGLPSNEVYSIIQDKKGFIWLGCDAGLYKFDGVRFIAYKSSTQKSKAITGLTLSSSGKLYCYNFKHQLFCLDDDHSNLKEIKCDFSNINYTLCDSFGNVFFSHIEGISKYNENLKEWKHYTDFHTKNSHIASSLTINSEQKICFIAQDGIRIIENEKTSLIGQKYFDFTGSLMVRNINGELFIFSTSKDTIYKERKGIITEFKNTTLNKALYNRQITNVVNFADGNLWITTYKGVIHYDIKKDSVQVFYPDLSFSNVIIDREGNYWLSTLQSGLRRVYSLNYIVWDKQNGSLEDEKLSKLATDGTNVFFASVNGTVGRINSLTNELRTFHTGKNGDIQSLDYEATENKLYFHINNRLFTLNNNSLVEQNNKISTLKAIKKINGSCFIASSFGTYIDLEKITENWSRQILYDSINQSVWVATNNGLLKLIQNLDGKWAIEKSFLSNIQVLSIDINKSNNQLVALCFDGKIHTINPTDEIQEIAVLPSSTQAYKIKTFQHQLFIASNKGVHIFDTEQKNWKQLNTLTGLASNNVQDILVLNKNLWLATGKGLQKISLEELTEKPLAQIYLKNKIISNLKLNYNQSLILFPEANIYTNNGIFEYAYRINQTEWIKLPSTIKQIELQNIPSGTFSIEVKAIDPLGRNSENTILVTGYMTPPFWLSWWFITICVLLFLFIVFLVFKWQWAMRKKKMQTQNEMNVLKLKALKSQMNPHFIFNVLSSIKGYIYENDRKKATLYLDDFSDLIRTILEQSEVQYATLEEELKTIKLYIDLEAMMLDHFSYQINISETINTNSIKIPSLILQPYVENAFKHGLRHKTGDKKLLINVFSGEGVSCIIEIEDNGIGRKAAEELNNNNTLKRQSFATSALEKRIALTNEENNTSISVNTIDLFDKKNNSIGTKISITIK